MLQAAFTSRSRTAEQLLQVHSRSFSCNSLLMFPQLEQVLLDGANRPIRMMFLPYHSDLYSNIVTKVDQLASCIACAKLWFLTIFFTAKVSIAIVWFSRISCVETLCKKSLRLFTTFSCRLASFFLVRLPLYFEYLRCTYFNLLCAFRRYLGFSKTSPSDVMAKSLIPKSTPMVVFSFIGALVGNFSLVSHSIETKYLPVGVTLMVALLITPLVGRCKDILIPSLNLGIIKRLFLTITFCGTAKLPPFVFFLNLGNPAPLKNLLYASSRLMSADCKDWLFVSFSQGNSFLRSTSCFCKSYLDRITLLPKYAVVFVSRARLYKNLTLPQCLCINSFCELVGYNRYLYARNINTNIRILTGMKKTSKIIINFIRNSSHPLKMSVISC